MPMLMLAIFETVPVTLWLIKDNIFYLFNFSYIGLSISLGVFLFTGVFEAATIHYAVAKIFGPLVFGRGWCGYACWTAMVLDFLPYKVPRGPRKKIGWIRYITFAVSLVFVAALFLAKVGNIERSMFRAFITGNVIYYAIGIILTYAFKDNRAFCKYRHKKRNEQLSRRIIAYQTKTHFL